MQLKTHYQASAYASPWTRGERVRALLWDFCWAVFCAWTPKPLNAWRLMWLRLFGASVEGTPFVHQRARITHPWKLVMAHRSCLGDGAHAYCLGKIVLEADCTVAQEAYLCAGTHDFDHPARPLQTAPIVICRSAFIGARAFVLPSITVGPGAVVGACSVVTKDIAPGARCAGNPARPLRRSKPEEAHESYEFPTRH